MSSAQHDLTGEPHEKIRKPLIAISTLNSGTYNTGVSRGNTGDLTEMWHNISLFTCKLVAANMYSHGVTTPCCKSAATGIRTSGSPVCKTGMITTTPQQLTLHNTCTASPVTPTSCVVDAVRFGVTNLFPFLFWLS